MSIAQLRLQLLASKQRGLLHLQGQRTWCYNWLNEALNELSDIDVLWFGEMDAQTDTSSLKQQLESRLKQYKKYLGQERDIVVFDVYSGFNPDAFGALTGTIKLGGLCVLLTPDDYIWPTYPDPELSRLCTEPFKISDIKQCYSQRLIGLLSSLPNLIKISEHKQTYPKLLPRNTLELTSEQSRLSKQLQALITADGKETCAAIVQADRGRGKSSLLGLLSANLLLEANASYKILVTAPLLDSVETLFLHCKTSLENTDIEVNTDLSEIRFSDRSIRFVAPDKLMLEQPDADLLLVDEAAAIPIQMLKPIVKTYKKAIFSTTVHGYEGTGRGFEYKLKPLLKQQYNRVSEFSLSQPIRWYQDDILEQAVNNLLALNSEIAKAPVLAPYQIEYRVWQQSELLDNEAKLTEIFALLINAHYRTSPTDLRQILDGPNISIATLEQHNQTLAAALIAREGNLNEVLSELVWQGRRRPRGHLFPQSLLAHSGFKQAGQYSYNRIIRIATHPELQGRGLGSKLLDELETWSTSCGCDFLCTSFGFDQRLFKFWQHAGLSPARLGLKQEASTGEFSILMFKPLTTEVTEFVEQVTVRFEQTQVVEQMFNIRELNIIAPQCELDLQLQAQDSSDLIAFAEHFRGLNTCLLAMVRFVYTTNELLQIPDIVVDKSNGKLTDEQLIKKYKLSGDKALTNHLREAWKKLLKQHAAIEMNT